MHFAPQPFDMDWTKELTAKRMNAMADFRQTQDDGDLAHARQALERSERQLALHIGAHVAMVLRDRGPILPPVAELLDTPFLAALKELTDDPRSTPAQITVGEYFLEDANMIFLATRPQEVDVIHQALLTRILEGNFRRTLLPQETCANTGRKVSYEIRGWQVEPGEIHFGHDQEHPLRYTFDPLTLDNVQAPAVQAVTLPVPSGVLLVCDWVRLPVLTELAENLDREGGFDALNSAHGRAQRTVRYAQELGVGHVFGREPTLIQSYGAVTAGYLHADAQSGDSIKPVGVAGQVEGDLRWTTLVDRQHLVELLSSRMDRETAEAQVSAFDSNPENQVIHLKVNPGTHHLYFAGDSNVFARTIGQAFQHQGLYLEEDFKAPVFALTEHPLEAAPQPATRRPGPGV